MGLDLTIHRWTSGDLRNEVVMPIKPESCRLPYGCWTARAGSEEGKMGFPDGHRETTTLVAGLLMSGMVVPMILDGPINDDCFEAYVT